VAGEVEGDVAEIREGASSREVPPRFITRRTPRISWRRLKVIESPLVGGALLLGVAGAIIAFAHQRRSQTIALLAILLSYYTSAINAIGSFTLFSNLLLTGAAVFFLIPSSLDDDLLLQPRGHVRQLFFLAISPSHRGGSSGIIRRRAGFPHGLLDFVYRGRAGRSAGSIELGAAHRVSHG
jgi:hypothetical protein